VSDTQGPGTREKLIVAATERLRRQGYAATGLDQVCADAGTSKGSFFHYFKSKEELAKSCLENWDAMAAGMVAGAPFQTIEDPVERLQGYMDFFIGLFANPGMYKSCLVGTTVQEVADSNPVLLEAAQCCFANAVAGMAPLIDAAAQDRGRRLDAAALAGLWMATLQGSLLLAKASGDDISIVVNMQQQRDFIMGLLG
jgi:TetR/AcrR family transcriptional repressor of nem operon